jgi:hypothetical protein
MQEHQNTEEPIDPTPSPDAAFAALAELVAMVADPKLFAARLRSLQRTLATIAKDEGVLNGAETSFDEHEKSMLQDIEMENSALTKRRGTIFSEQPALELRKKRLAALKKAWHFFQEDNDVSSGFRSPSVPALEKARIAFGVATPEAPPTDAHFPDGSRYVTPPDELQRAGREGLRRQSRSAAIRGK